MDKEQSIRERLKSGALVGKEYCVIYRPVGSTQAVIDIEGMRFTVDDSTRPMAGGMVLGHKSRRKSQMPELRTQGDVVEFFNSYPKLGKTDFIVVDRKHVPRNYGNNKVPSFTQD